MKYTVTTAIAYVNAEPHIGFAFEVLAADVAARYRALVGDEIRFITGTDEHGTKIARAASKAKLEPQPFTNKMSQRYRNLTQALGITEHVFIRTTDLDHKKVAQEIWKQADKNGDIYKKNYQGLYCVGCEAFLAPSQLDKAGKCCIHGTTPENIEEENYFFKLSKYNAWLKKYLKENPNFVRPVGRYNEIKALVDQGLEDISISRPKEKLAWGIEVPGDSQHVMYVWFDALTNYLTGCEYLQDTQAFKKYWPADVHIVGQEILRFHAALWSAMLKSAGLAIPKQIYSHGMILDESGRKMSKSLGNVVNPFKLIDKFGLESVRYHLLAEVPFADGGRFSEKRLLERYNSELANGIGNLVARVTTMCKKFTEEKVPVADLDVDLTDQRKKLYAEYDQALNDLRFHEALSSLNRFVTWANQYVDKEKPWILAQKNPTRLQQVLLTLLESIKTVGVHLVPFLPQTAEKILSLLKIDMAAKLSDLRTQKLIPGTLIAANIILFPKKEK